MKISIRITPNSKVSKISKLGENKYLAKVAAPAIEGKANSMLIEILAEHFVVSRSKIRILRGAKGREKVVEIDKS